MNLLQVILLWCGVYLADSTTSKKLIDLMRCGAKICTEAYAPICGTNGVTYPNLCLLRNSAKCWQYSGGKWSVFVTLDIEHKGECKGTGPKKDQKPTEDSIEKCQQRVCKDPKTKSRHPYCGWPDQQRISGAHISPGSGELELDRRTNATAYSSYCDLLKTMCQKPMYFTPGKCKTGEEKQLLEDQVCKRATKKANEQLKWEKGWKEQGLGDRIHPVCGSDGQTYESYWLFHKKAACKDTSLTKAHDGRCKADGSNGDRDDFGDDQEEGRDGIYDMEYDRSVDDDDIDDGARQKARHAKGSKHRVSKSRGYRGGRNTPVDQLTKDRPRKERRPIRSKCDSMFCSTNFSPVCGTDGQTYANLCQLRHKAKCSDSSLVVDYKGECKEGDTIEKDLGLDIL